jgi:hypothetical protein
MNARCSTGPCLAISSQRPACESPRAMLLKIGHVETNDGPNRVKEILITVQGYRVGK